MGFVGAAAILFVVAAMALVGAVSVIAFVLFAWGERPVRLPPSLRLTEISSIRHAPSRHWLEDHAEVLKAAGFSLTGVHLTESVVRPGRAAVAWFVAEGKNVLGLLLVSPHVRRIAFQSGRGLERVETTSSAEPVTLACREPVRRELRRDLTDPVALLRAHEALGLELPAGPATIDEMAAELQASYERVAQEDARRGWRVLRDGVAKPTIRGRAAAVGRELSRRLRRMREDLARA